MPTSFQIKGMCCGEEVAMLKHSVGPLVGGELNLSFDLLRKEMTVLCPEEILDSGAIRAAVARTGMVAIPACDSATDGECPVETSAWERYGRLATCLLSGLLMLTGFILQARHSGGLLAALVQNESQGSGSPFEVLLSYGFAIVAGAWFVAPRALYAVRNLRPDMNLLMCVAILGAVWIGQWFEAASVSFLFALALLMESWSIGRVRRAIRSVVEITPQLARIVCPSDGDIEEVAVSAVQVGTLVLVRPGEKIPLDGVVTTGESSVDQSPITGESIPLRKIPGNEVYAGTINCEGVLEFRSSRISSDTAVARIIRMVEEAQSRRAPVEQWIERFARFYTPVMMLLAILIAVTPPLFTGGSWPFWFYQALVLLVIACPCSLVISTPVSIVAGLTLAAHNGVLIKGGAYLESPAHIRTVAFDKTGTLTFGRPVVRDLVPLGGHDRNTLLSVAAALESCSTHPLATAIVQHAVESGISFTQATSFINMPGLGGSGVTGGRTAWIGNSRLLSQSRYAGAEIENLLHKLENQGATVVGVWSEEEALGLIGLVDVVRPQAARTIDLLRQSGITDLLMITGDNKTSAARAAAEAGIEKFTSDMLPEDKVKLIKELKDTRGGVAMVGDGINDAPAMAEASVSIAMGMIGTDVAIETADITLIADDLSKIPWLIRHSRRVMRVIKQNVGFSIAIKSLFVILAMTGNATLWSAIAADMGASLLVIFNGLRLLTEER